jgi:hypothetical protein
VPAARLFRLPPPKRKTARVQERVRRCDELRPPTET